MKFIYFFISFLHGITAYCQSFTYLPFGPDDNHIIKYSEFTLSYNDTHLQPNWVAYELTADELLFEITRKNYFKEDRNVGTRWASLDDYSLSGYDRGHICRAEFCKANEVAYRESFLLSNMSPQIGASFNRTGGIWHNLEELEMKLANYYGKVYSVSGPVFKDNLGTIGKNNVTIPGYFFKAFLLPDYKAAIGFILRHEVSDKDPLAYVVTIDSLEIFTGFDFYPSLPDVIEDEIEATLNLTYWNSSHDYEKPEKSITASSNESASYCKGTARTTGDPCTRKTTNESGYCWQHEDQNNRIKESKKEYNPINDNRCKAKTKSGSRCKRPSNDSGYCWQHE